MPDIPTAGRRGAASVEYLALGGMIGLLIVIAIAALVASPPRRGDRELGEMLARRIACAPRYPVPCGRNPLALAYGFPLGKLVRYLAPEPVAVAGELPVDFRYCRQASCAAPGDEPGLTASGRRVTEFTSVVDRRSAGGPVRITYWLYRPGLGWERVERTAGSGRDRGRLRHPAEPRGRTGAGPAGDAPGPGPLPVPAGRGASLALVGPVTPARSPLPLELRCAIAALHGKQ